MTWLPLLIVVGWFLVLLLVVGILLVAFKPRPQRPGWVGRAQPDAATGAGHPAGAPTYAGTWNAEVLGDAGFGVAARAYGIFHLEDGVLSFVRDGTATPVWSVPCHQLAARRRGFFELDGADVRLVGPMGELRCSVSTEHINRFSANTMKDLRERGYADEFVRLLWAHGAGIAQ